METDDAFTLILTKGSHLISSRAAEQIRLAIERNDTLVDVVLDPLGEAGLDRVTTIAVRHVVALTRSRPQLAAGYEMKNVAIFRQHRPRNS